MKNRFLLLTAIALTSISATSCFVRINKNALPKAVVEGSSNYITKTVEIGEFNSLNVKGSLDVIYENGANRVEILAPDNIIGYVEVVNKDNSLDIGMCDSLKYFYDSLLVRVYGGSVSSVSLDGSGDLVCKDIDVAPKDFSVALAGSGDVRISDVKAAGCRVRLSGSGDLWIGGVNAGHLETALAGSGNIVVEGVRSDNLKVSLAGSGDIRMSGTAVKAKYSVAGSGYISAEDLDASDVSVHKSGSGQIRYMVSGKHKSK